MAGETETIITPFKAAYIAQKWYEWKSNRSSVEKMWKEIEAYKYATDTTSLPNNIAGFDHTTHIPLTMELSQDLHALIKGIVTPHKDWFIFDPDTREAAKIENKVALEAYIKNRHKLNGANRAISLLIHDLIDKGNCFVMVVFEAADKIGYSGPKLVRLSPWDIVFNPTSPTFDQAPKIIREELSIGEFLKKADRLGWDEEAVAKVRTARTNARITAPTSTSSGTDKDEQYVPQGFGSREQYLQSGTVEVLWFYGDLYDADADVLSEDSIIVTADGDSVLFEGEVGTLDGKPHIYQGVWEQRPENLWGMGPLENIIGLNYQIDHRENAKSTGLDKLILPDLETIGDVEEIYDAETGQTRYLAPEGGGVREIRPDTTFLNADLHIDRLTEQARKAARLPTDLVGFRSAGEKTFGEVAQLIEGAMRGFIDKAEDFETEVLEKVLGAELELASKNLDSQVLVPGGKENGIIPFISVDPAALKSKGTFIPVGAKRFARKNQIVSTLAQLSSTPLMQIASPHISGKGAAELLRELLEIEDSSFFKEFAQIVEGAEAQQLANAAEQEVAGSVDEPSVAELSLEREIANGQ